MSYYYLYDSFLKEKKYQKILSRIETRLTDLGLNGKISRLNILQNLQELITDEIKRGVKTVVVVGNDQTINAAIGAVAGSKAVLGILPVGAPQTIALALGIAPCEEACSTLSARKIEKLDLGKINNQYFLCSVQIPPFETIIECEESYRIMSLEKKSQINIYNLRCSLSNSQTNFSSPQDGILETIIEQNQNFLATFLKKHNPSASIFPTRKITIKNKKSIPLLVDGQMIVNTPAVIEVAREKLQVIVGKNRKF